MTKKAFAVTVTGHVQGVGFRYYALRKAKELTICGFVKNLADGSVYAEIEGPEEDCESFIGWCKTGPARANVVRLEVNENSPAGYSDFRIR